MTDTLTIDFDRHRRLGFPEVVFGQHKTVNEVVAAATRLVEAHQMVLITRASDEALEALHKALPAGRPWPRSHCFSVGLPEPKAGPVALCSAGTSDESVAEEAFVTARMRGVAVKRFSDCGVAGVHRVLCRIDEIRSCVAVIVIAGMDGALPSLVGGLVDVPVIACPTSIGYGVATGGHAALNSMLASCAPGVTVVNIDNGFGAGYAAASIALTVLRGVSAQPA